MSGNFNLLDIPLFMCDNFHEDIKCSGSKPILILSQPIQLQTCEFTVAANQSWFCLNQYNYKRVNLQWQQTNPDFISTNLQWQQTNPGFVSTNTINYKRVNLQWQQTNPGFVSTSTITNVWILKNVFFN